MKLIKKLLVLDGSDLALELLLTTGFWVLGEGVGWIASNADETITSIPPIGLLVALIGGTMMMTAFSANRFGFEFGWLLQFGVLRRRQLTAQLVVQWLHGAAVAVLALLLGLVGRPLERLWYGSSMELISLWEILSPWVVMAMVAVPPLVGLFAGGCYRRFGRWGGYMLYFCFMVICVSMGRILDQTEALIHAGFGLPLAAGAAMLLAVLTVLGTHWLLTLDN